MSDKWNVSIAKALGAAVGAIVILAVLPLDAQQSDTEKRRQVKPGTASARKGQSEPSEGDRSARNRVVIDRQALKLIDPKTYQVPLQLSPIRAVDLAAPVTGVVRAVHLQSGEQVDAQTEAVRLDSTEEQLLLQQAKAQVDVAQIELNRAQKQNDSELVELAEAKLRAAKAGLELATHRLNQTRVRVPFSAEVFRVHVVEGQFVRAGKVLLHAGDTSQLKVEIPVDRNEVSPGQTVSLRVEKTPVEVTIQHVLPLSERLEPLRDLIPSAASAVAVIENQKRKLHAGQTVYAPLIPRDPVAEVPISSIANGPEGTRKVQVVREQTVRDIPVELLAQLGNDRIYVSGPFADHDELIVRSSQELPDGTQIRPLTAAAGKRSPSSRSDEPRSKPSPSDSDPSKPDF